MKSFKLAIFVLSGALALSGSAFAIQSLPQGYLLSAAAHGHAGDEEAAEANCREGKCGAGTEKDATSKAELAFELCEIYGLDQGIRDPGLNFKAGDVWPQIDILNFNRIVLFLENNGYPNEELLGKENMQHECVSAAFTAVLLHNPHRLVSEQRYFDLFFK
jgi:uncharacterized low-complexity protein